MIECYHCGVEFKVKFDDPDAEITFCPACGVDTDPKAAVPQLEFEFDDDE